MCAEQQAMQRSNFTGLSVSRNVLSILFLCLRKNLLFSNIRLEIITLVNVYQLVDFFMGGQGNNNLSLAKLIASQTLSLLIKTVKSKVIVYSKLYKPLLWPILYTTIISHGMPGEKLLSNRGKFLLL